MPLPNLSIIGGLITLALVRTRESALITNVLLITKVLIESLFYKVVNS